MKKFLDFENIRNNFLPLLDNPCAQTALARLRKSRRNILAFSHGTDSTALFYALLAARVPFAAALVNYRAREGADAEQAAAAELCAHYGVEFFTRTAPPLAGNFEAAARALRYEFFASLAPECLASAHNLNDQLEWLLMRLARGSGAAGLGAMSAVAERENYALVRPFARLEKSLIMQALQASGARFFNDPTNASRAFERNRLRADFAAEFAAANARGIARSLDLLAADAAQLAPQIKRCEGFCACVYEAARAGFCALALAKIYAALPSRRQLEETSRQLAECGEAEIFLGGGGDSGGGGGDGGGAGGDGSSRRLIFAIFRGWLICAPAAQNPTGAQKSALTSAQKDTFRRAKIPPKLRPLCAANPAAHAALLDLAALEPISP